MEFSIGESSPLLCSGSNKARQETSDPWVVPRVSFPCTQRLGICYSFEAFVDSWADPHLQGSLKMPQVGSSRRESLQDSQPHPTTEADRSHPNLDKLHRFRTIPNVLPSE